MTEAQILNLKLELMGIDYAYSRSDLFDAKNKIFDLERAVEYLLYELKTTCYLAGMDDVEYEQKLSVGFAKKVLNK